MPILFLSFFFCSLCACSLPQEGVEIKEVSCVAVEDLTLLDSKERDPVGFLSAQKIQHSIAQRAWEGGQEHSTALCHTDTLGLFGITLSIAVTLMVVVTKQPCCSSQTRFKYTQSSEITITPLAPLDLMPLQHCILSAVWLFLSIAPFEFVSSA